MHVALVVDPERLLTDAAAVQRLAVALAGDGVRIRRILPPARDEPPLLRMIAASTFTLIVRFSFDLRALEP